jgi:hypothetical protein
MTEDQRYMVQFRSGPDQPWYTFTFEDGVPRPLGRDNAYEEAARMQNLGRCNPNWPKYETRVLPITSDEDEARLQRRQLVIARGQAMALEAAEAIDAGNYPEALDLLRQARACAVALNEPLNSDYLDTFVSRMRLA